MLTNPRTLVSIDPGMVTGIVVGTYSETEPFTMTHAFQIQGGVEGFIKEVSTHFGEAWSGLDFAVLRIGSLKRSIDLYRYEMYYHEGWENCDEGGDDHFCPEERRIEGAEIICEKFTARGGGNNFSYRTDALEPLRVEGAILAMGLKPTWCSPQQQYFAGGKGAEAKKRAHAWLKENGLYISPKSVYYKDANDARSAALHAIAYLRRAGHRPTIEHYFPKTEED